MFKNFKMKVFVVIFAASLTFSHVLAGSLHDTDNDISVFGFLKCGFQSEPLNCAKSKTGRALDNWEDSLQVEMKKWGEAADVEVMRSGRQLSELEEPPSSAAQKLQLALNELVNILQKSLYSSMARKKSESSGGGIESITITANQEEQEKHKKKKKKKHNKKPVGLHIHPGQQQQGMEKDKDQGLAAEMQHRGDGEELIQVGERVVVDAELAGPEKIRVKREGDVGEERGKKKKKKKAILKLLLLGAVLKAKIGLFLQLLSAHLQVKFFAIALAGLALNIARFWLDLKKGHAPQKVIYYEHAQHQHHYEHDDEHGWGGAWSRSIDSQPAAANPQKIYSYEEPHHEYIESGPTAEEGPYSGWSEKYGKARSMKK